MEEEATATARRASEATRDTLAHFNTTTVSSTFIYASGVRGSAEESEDDGDGDDGSGNGSQEELHGPP